jgi:3-hydroxyisobutyrate dehydrogenase-like beta-hydroxyacid dehydrogenase
VRPVQRIGFVGLGAMGGPIANRLLAAGRPVIGYNRTRGKADWLVERGLELRASPREVAAGVDLVCTAVTDTAALAAVTDGPDGILAGLDDGKILVDMSTVSPMASRELAGRVAERGARMLDCPISGAPVTVEAGKASVMAGGDEDAFRAAEPVLRDIGAKVIHVGGNGQAVLMKVAINLSLAVQFVAFSEGLLMAEKGGIAREVALESMLASVIASPSLAYRAPFVERLPDPAWFDVAMMQKDLLLALDTARALDVPMPATAVTNELLTTARGMGLGHHDFSVIYHTIARMAGRDEPRPP